MAHYTYGIAAYNFKTKMNEVLPATFTSKKAACEHACKMKRLGAKNVKVVCDQTKREITIL